MELTAMMKAFVYLLAALLLTGSLFFDWLPSCDARAMHRRSSSLDIATLRQLLQDEIELANRRRDDWSRRSKRNANAFKAASDAVAPFTNNRWGGGYSTVCYTQDELECDDATETKTCYTREDRECCVCVGDDELTTTTTS